MICTRDAAMKPAFLAAGLLGILLLSACQGSNEARQAEKAKQLAKQLSVPTVIPDEEGGIEGATPMKDRVARLGLLNKRNGLVREIEIKPGEAIRLGRVIVRLRACERTASWELASETGAFVQLVVQGQDNEWRRVFSGWLFKERPDRNIIQHPIYDVFVRSCAMTYPGDPTAAPAKEPSAAASAAGSENAASSAPKSAAAPAVPVAATGGGDSRGAPASDAPKRPEASKAVPAKAN